MTPSSLSSLLSLTTSTRSRTTRTTRTSTTTTTSLFDQQDPTAEDSTTEDEATNEDISKSSNEQQEQQPLDLQRQQQPTSQNRFVQALPFKNDKLDTLILKTAIPSILNLAVVPIVNSVDTFWVGRLGQALALAGQAAANQVSFTIYFLIAFVPSITAPLVASAVASGDSQEAKDRVCESLWLCWVLGTVGTLSLVLFPRAILKALLLPADAPALDFAAPYLRWRALGMVPSLIAATGSAAYRGLLDTMTPLKVSMTTNLVNLFMDPLFIFGTGGIFRGSSGLLSRVFPGLGFLGAAIATAGSETLGGVLYLRLLLKRKLAEWKLILRPPPLKALLPILAGGSAMLLRQIALNVGFLVATRRAQNMDPTGVCGAAYGITMQIYSVGIICLVGMQNSAAALVPSFRAAGAKKHSSDGDAVVDGNAEARACADRLLSWSTLMGVSLGGLQFALLPVLVPLFSNLPAVQEAVKVPTLIASLIHVMNGPILAGEGILIGTGCFRALALITSTWIASMVAFLTLTPLGKRLDGIMWSILLSSTVQAVGVVGYYLKIGPLAKRKKKKSKTQDVQSVVVDEATNPTGEAPEPSTATVVP